MTTQTTPMAISELRARYSDRDLASVPVRELHSVLKGYVSNVKAKCRQELVSTLTGLLAPADKSADTALLKAAKLSQAREQERVALLAQLPYTEVLAWLAPKSAHTARHYLKALHKVDYFDYVPLRDALSGLVQQLNEDYALNVRRFRHSQLWPKHQTLPYLRQLYTHALNVLVNYQSQSPWEVLLAVMLVTGRRSVEVTRMQLRQTPTGAWEWAGKAKGKRGQYDGKWFPFYSLYDAKRLQPVLQWAQSRVLAYDGTAASASAISTRLNEAADNFPAPEYGSQISCLRAKDFRKVAAGVICSLDWSRLPVLEAAKLEGAPDFGEPTEILICAVSSEKLRYEYKRTWLLGHSSCDQTTQNSYEIFNLSQSEAAQLLRATGLAKYMP